jgi:hypothetical protein
MKVKLSLFAASFALTASLYAQNGNMGVGTSSPNSAAKLEVSSTNSGFLPPRLTTTQRDAIASKPAGLMIYNMDVNCLQYWNSNAWVSNCASSNNGTATIADCTTGALNGTYQGGTAMNSGNTVILSVNVTQTGSWIASSNTANGVTFNGTGTFTATGTQNITLTASGTPPANGTFAYTFNLGGNSCARNVTFSSTPAPVLVQCSTAYGANAFPGTFTIGANSVNVTATATCATYPSSNDVYSSCLNFIANPPWLLDHNVSGADVNTSSITFNFSQPVTNVQFILINSDPTTTLTFTTNNGIPTLTKLTNSCNNNWTISNNQISGYSGIIVNSGGVYYTQLKISYNGPTSNGPFGAVHFCNASSQ